MTFMPTQALYNQRLVTHLGSMKTPRNQDLLSPIAGDRTRTDIFENWDRFWRDEGLPEELLNLEKDKRRAAGPRSLTLADWWIEPLSKFGHNRKSFNATTVERCKYELQRYRFSPTPQITRYLSKTSAGYPWMGRAENSWTEIVQQTRDMWDNPSSYVEEANTRPYVLGKRTTPYMYPDQSKSRVIWMESKPFAIIGSFYTSVLNAQFSTSTWFSALRAPWDLYREMMVRRVPGSNVVSLDQSQFDANISPDMIRQATDVVSSLCQTQGDWINLLGERAIRAPMLIPDGTFVHEGGIPSGHPFTNLIDSLVSLMAASESLDLLGIDHTYENIWVMGDDCLLTNLPYLPAVTEISDAYANLGLIVNPSKQAISDDYYLFLNKYFDKEFLGVRSLNDGLNSIISLERPNSLTKVEWIYRTLSQIEECRNHPHFTQLIDYVLTLDKYRLGLELDLPYWEIEREGKPRGNPFYDNVIEREASRGMGSWSVIQYLQQLGL